ncbi:MAG: universal stress protein [Elainellaceae cyanobacterium]
MLTKILAAIDNSAASMRAFETALELAQALKAEPILVHALDVFGPASPERPAIAATSYSIPLDELLRKSYEQRWGEFVSHYDALLKQKQEEAEAMGVSASSLQPYGRPGPAICEAARVSDADLIVVGSRDRSGLRELTLTSISSYLMHHAPCSVMVVHTNDVRHHAPKEDAADISAPTPRDPAYSP